MMYGKIILLLVLALTLIASVPVATATEKLDVAVIDGAAIPFAKEDHLAYGIVKMWNKADVPVTATLSITPNRDHRLDDNRYWGNYREVENIKIGANELHIQVFCFVIPASSNMGKQAWTLNVTTGKQIVTKEIVIDLATTKNVEIAAPSWQPDILQLTFPAAKPDTITVKASEPKMALLMLKMAGNLNTAKIYDVQIDTTLPDIFFAYPKKIVVTMSEPGSWDFENQGFLPFTVIPVPLLTMNVPYSTSGNIYELRLRLKEKKTDLEAYLPFQLVVTTPTAATKETIASIEDTEVVIIKNTTTETTNETKKEKNTDSKNLRNSDDNSSEITVNSTVEKTIASKEDENQKGIDWTLVRLITFVLLMVFLLILGGKWIKK